MGAAYEILGKSVPAHYLALGTIGSVVALVMPKPWNGTSMKPPQIKASSPEEEKFVKEYLAKLETSEKH